MNKINRDHISGFIVGILGYKLVSSIFKKSRKIKDSKKLILYRVTREKIIFELNLEAFQLGQNERVRIEILVEGKKQFPELTLDLDNLQEFAQNNTNKLQSYRFSLIDNNGKELIPRCLPINIDGSRYIPEIQDLEKNPDELWQIVRQMHIGINSLKRKLNIMVVGMCNNGKSSFLNTIFTALYQNIYSCSQNFAIFDQHTTNCIAPYKYDDNPFITFFDTPGWEETFKSYIMIETIKGHLRHDLKVSHLQGEEVCVKIDPQNVVPLIDLVILVEKLDYTANLNNTARPSFHKFIREITDSGIPIIPVFPFADKVVPNANITNRDIPMRQEIAEYFCDNLEKNLTYFNRSEAFPLICLRDHTDNLCVYRDWIVMRILEIAINKTKKNNEE